MKQRKWILAGMTAMAVAIGGIPVGATVSDGQGTLHVGEKSPPTQNEELQENEQTEPVMKEEEAAAPNDQTDASDKDLIVPDAQPDTENEAAEESKMYEKENCTPVPGLESPGEMRAAAYTIPGQWLMSNGRWWYRHNDGGYTINGWESINGQWYYFDGQGYMCADIWINNGDGTWYYVDGNGMMVTASWIRGKEGGWYYVDGSGKMATSQWIWGVEGGWYYVGGDGKMVIGWVNDGGTWYYTGASGKMLTGWITLGDNEYFLDNASGRLHTGWFKELARWHYSNSSGSWQITSDVIGCSHGKTTNRDFRYYYGLNQLTYRNYSNFSTAVSSAVDSWNSKVSSMNMKSTTSSSTNLEIYNSSDLEDYTLGRTLIVQNGSYVNSKDVTYNWGKAKISLNVNQSSSINSKVVIHEIGHALGLTHIFSHKGALQTMMYPDNAGLGIGSNDVACANHLY